MGHSVKEHVMCRNSVIPIDCDGTMYRCHSDLYGQRKQLSIGNILDPQLQCEHRYRDCSFYGTCSPCDVKVKTNHLQEYGYTSVDIVFDEG